MDAWTITNYWYLFKINPRANERKFYAVYVMVEAATGKRYVGSQYGRIGSEMTGGTFRKLMNAEAMVSEKLAKGYKTGDLPAQSVLVEGPTGMRFKLKAPNGSAPQPAAAPPAAPDVPSMLQELWLATEVDGNAFVSYSLVRGDGWLVPYKRELVLKEGVQKLMFDVHKDERGIAQVRCIVEHPGGGLTPSIAAVSVVLSYEPGEKNLHLCSIDQLRSL